jgi:hypothetical protein
MGAMTCRRRPDLHRLLVSSVALAAAACAAACASSQTAAGRAFTEGFAGVDAGRAFPRDIALVGFIERRHIEAQGGSVTICDPSPCSPKWKHLLPSFETATPNTIAAVVRRGDALVFVREADFPSVIGPIDTIEKAALAAKLTGRFEPMTCAEVEEHGYACADDTPEKGIAARQVAGGWELLTREVLFVCPNPDERGHEVAVLGVMKIGRDGQPQGVANAALARETAAKWGDNGGCALPVPGRRFEGFEDLARERTELEYHVRTWRYEAAAVIAFERLARELETHGAPAEIVRDTRRAANDERRHAIGFRREAERLFDCLGLDPSFPALDPPGELGVRPLAEVILENAIEGCANETYAAIVATHQAAHAPARLRRMLSAIARDEQRHAELSHRIHRWGLATLPSHEADRVETARIEAGEALRGSVDVGSVASALGAPPEAVAALAFAMVSAALAA